MKTDPKPNKANFPILLVLVTLIPSFISSKAFTDPFIIPKYYWLYFLSAGALVIFALWNFFRKYKTSYTINPLDIAVITFFIYSITRAFLTPALSLANDNLLALIICMALYLLYKPWFSVNIENSTTHEYLITGITLLCLLQSVYGISQAMGMLPALQDKFKLGGAFGNPGPYSNFVVAIYPFCLVQLLYAKKGTLQYYLSILAFLASIVVLPLTQARSAWIAVVISSIFILYQRFELKIFLLRLFKSNLVKLISALLIISFIAASAIFLFKFKEQSASGRLFVWKISTQMIPDKPFFGFGYDRFPVFYNNYQCDYFSRGNYTEQEAELADNVTYAFNEYLQTAIETGVIGLLLFLCIMFLAFSKPVNKQGETDIVGPLVLAAKSALVAILITALFSYPIRNVPINVFLFLILAMISANQANYKEFKITQQFRRTASLAGLVIIVFFIIGQLPKFKASKQWVNAFKQMRSNNYAQAKVMYEDLYAVLNYNPYFLFNYGAELSLMGEYNKSIEMLNKAGKGLNDADLYIYLGNSYAGTNNLEMAEKCFIKASNMMPVKFYPKYRLVKIYIQKGENDKAKILAIEILDKKVKIPSEIIDNIRNEMKQVVEEN